MTDKEIIRHEYSRLVGRLEDVDPIMNPRLYKELLDCIDILYFLRNNDTLTGEPGELPTAEEIVAEVTSAPIPEIEEPEEAPAYSKEDVRAALAKSRKNGTNVTELLEEFGCSNFSALPAAKYPELMARLGES